MKTNSLLVAMLLAGTGLCLTRSANAYATYPVEGEIRRAADFYEPLAQYGYWVNIGQYGWCWYPAHVVANWRPYLDGHWVWCDQGWYWESDEPWAWATYHYGRWAWDSYQGWVWVPDVEWAPSWVWWREGGGYVGWAPLPPQYDYAPRTEVVVIQPQYFIFVECRHFCQPIEPSILVVNQTVINQTVNITKFGKGSQVVINPGPNLAAIERNNPGRVTKVKLEHRLPTEVQQVRQQRQELAVAQPIAPPVIHGTRHNADASTVVSMLTPPPQAGNSGRPVGVEKVQKSERRQNMPPPTAVVAPPKSRSLPPTAVAPDPSEHGRGQKPGGHKHEDDTGTISIQGR